MNHSQMLVRTAMIAFGVVLILASLNDVFQSVIVPRAVGRRLRPSYYQSRILWTIWPRLAHGIYPNNEDRREDFLAAFAPFNLIANLLNWSFLMLIGYGAIFYALRAQVHPPLATFGEAFYFAGTSFFTIGFGDYAGTSGLTRLASLAAGACGFGIISTTTAYLFAIFGAFQNREQFVVMVSARAGAPPSGVGLLAIAAHARVVKDLPTLMRSAEMWCASLMETHLAYPILAYFRSSHDYESWVATLGTLLDTAVLMITTVQCDAGESRILYNIGRHATHDLSKYFRLEGDERDPGITREQFDEACTRLESAGLTLNDRDSAWSHFALLRCAYAGHLNALAAFFQVPTLQWLGPHSLVEAPHIREQLPPEMLERIDDL
ncbi:MAG TPA: potassium channel family protein, partial [Candidatus Acidoferrum sp.]|nr:potassium channel family protein [Candidatus Acidoferrum sp.]